jgi:hypothetical protein
MGLLARRPFAIAPYRGENAFINTSAYESSHRTGSRGAAAPWFLVAMSLAYYLNWTYR